MADIIQLRRDTATNWTSANPVLAQGELGVETDTDKIKVGDGSTAWTSLGYLIDTGGYALSADVYTQAQSDARYAQFASPTFTGTVTADGVTIGSSTITETASDLTISATDDLLLEANGNRVFQAWDNGSLQYVLISNGNQNLAQFDPNGDISFYEDTGTTPKFFWDASAESLGIGTTSPTAKLDVSGTVKATNYTDTVYALSGTALDPANGGIQTKTLAANTTFTDSLASGESIVLQLEAGASYTVTWPTMQWATSGGNVAPTLTAKDTLVFWKVSSVLYGAYTGSYV